MLKSWRQYILGGTIMVEKDLVVVENVLEIE
jgi:hypothetical protein